jgi:site-specific recombinase XerC
MVGKALEKHHTAEIGRLESAIPADRNPLLVYLASLGGNRSRTVVLQRLNRIAGLVSSGLDATSLDWSKLRYQHVAAIRATLIESGLAPATCNAMLSAVKGVLRECWRLQYLDTENYHRAVDVKGIKGERIRRGRSLSMKDVGALFRTCANDESSAGRRDAGILAVMLGAGLRREEVVSLDCADYDPENGQLLIRSGKGNKDRTAYVSNGSKIVLEKWLVTRQKEDGPLFNPVSQTGEIDYRRISAQAIYMMLRKRGKQAKLQDFAPHDCRRFFASTAIDQSGDLSAISSLLGHKSISTTVRYDVRDERKKQNVVELLTLPVFG